MKLTLYDLPQVHVIALINDPGIIQRILEHLGLWDTETMQRGHPEETDPADWPSKAQLPLEYVPVPDIA